MTEDAEGFRYPVADADACTGCGLCERICPGLHPSAPHDPLRLFAARNRDEAARAAGSSGGVFSLLARRTLHEGGVVFGAAFVPTWGGVSHRKAEKEEELQPLLKSKYVQGDTGGCYTEAAALLREGRRVLFSGTPCQIAGTPSSGESVRDDCSRSNASATGFPPRPSGAVTRKKRRAEGGFSASISATRAVRAGGVTTSPSAPTAANVASRPGRTFTCAHSSRS